MLVTEVGTDSGTVNVDNVGWVKEDVGVLIVREECKVLALIPTFTGGRFSLKLKLNYITGVSSIGNALISGQGET